MIDYRVYLVTDDPSRYRGNWLDAVTAAVGGGVTCVQYRDTESPSEVRYQRARSLRDALGRVPLIVNNDAELAAAVGADGVHVGQGDLPPRAVRAIVGAKCAIGLSITAPEQVAAIDRREVDALGIGPVFDARRTKRDAAAPLGPEGLGAIVALTPGLPHVAIGGITTDNAAAVLAAGADGLAVVSAFSQAENPHEVARAFRMLSDHRGK